jgi:hypothetical protein
VLLVAARACGTCAATSSTYDIRGETRGISSEYIRQIPDGTMAGIAFTDAGSAVGLSVHFAVGHRVPLFDLGADARFPLFEL